MPLVPVLKLHGSVNWARRADSKQVEIFKRFDDVLTAELVPELVPPTWKKTFEDPVERVWDEAIKKLNTATRIVIIGFSMPPTDMHFKYLIAAGLQNNVSLREVIFVNPDPQNELESRARKIFREAYVDTARIRFSKNTLRNFTYGHPNEIEALGRSREQGMVFDLF